MKRQISILLEKLVLQFRYPFLTVLSLFFLCSFTTVQTLVSSDQVQLVEGPIPCNTQTDFAEYDCFTYKAIVNSDDPKDDFYEALLPNNVLLIVRKKKETPWTNRWVTFHSPGRGAGYGSDLAGDIPPGEYFPGNQYGDDLIHWYNERGYVTLDILWQCSENGAGAPCSNSPLSGWVAGSRRGQATAWYRNSGGTGYVGVSSRTKAIIQWAIANNGDFKVGAHGNSGGSGRLIAVLTRYQGEDLFDTVVLDGGPVFAYIPWYCGLEDDGNSSNGTATPGPLGPAPDRYNLLNPNGKDTYDLASDPGNGGTYTACADGVWDEERMMEDSNFYRASDRDFSELDLSVVFGGLDTSPASPHAFLWFQGYTFGTESIPPLSANTVSILQGYCTETDSNSTFTGARGEKRPCSDWDAELFGSATRVEFLTALTAAPHQTSAREGGASVLFESMLSTLELHPE